MLARFFIYTIGAGFLFSSPIAQAHGGHDPRLKVAVSETEIRIETSLGVEAFMGFDANGDGKLTVSEYETQYENIAAWIESKLHLVEDSQDRVEPYFADAPIVDRGHLEKTDEVENVKILRRYKLSEKPSELRLTLKLYDESPQLLYSRSGSMKALFEFKICVPSTPDIKKTTCHPTL